jgi:putative hemolysin
MDHLLDLRKGRYHARIASGSADLAAAQSLRRLCFGQNGNDSDSFDAQCQHILIENSDCAALVCCFRVLPMQSAREISRSYSAQFYDLTALSGFAGPILEIGRFCIHPDAYDPDILRIAWGALTQWVDKGGIRLLFGCSSFPGDEAAPHLDAFALLHAKHQAPDQWRPKAKAAKIFDFATELEGLGYNGARAQTSLPPLLRTYLLMGGWVSDHAVFDHQLRTMHVFTGVEIAAIPATRARLLRAVAG